MDRKREGMENWSTKLKFFQDLVGWMYGCVPNDMTETMKLNYLTRIGMCSYDIQHRPEKSEWTGKFRLGRKILIRCLFELIKHSGSDAALINTKVNQINCMSLV